jgi:hypothetical protein
MVFGSGFAYQTSDQAQAYLLCEECEARFRREGEDWVLANCLRPGGRFPLRETLDQAAPAWRDPEIRIYSCTNMAGVSVDAIIYFALSVFWRAAVHRWIIAGHSASIDLGPYEEAFRCFLLHEAPFPGSAALCVLVWARNAELAMNPNSGNEDGFHYHQFGIPGLAFMLFVGGNLPGEYLATSLAPSADRYITIYPKAEELHLLKLSKLYNSRRHQ